MKLEDNEIVNNDDCETLYSYYSCWKSKTERLNAIFQCVVEVGGQTVNAGNKVDDANDKQWHQFSIINFAFQ